MLSLNVNECNQTVYYYRLYKVYKAFTFDVTVTPKCLYFLVFPHLGGRGGELEF